MAQTEPPVLQAQVDPLEVLVLPEPQETAVQLVLLERVYLQGVQQDRF